MEEGETRKDRGENGHRVIKIIEEEPGHDLVLSLETHTGGFSNILGQNPNNVLILVANKCYSPTN